MCRYCQEYLTWDPSVCRLCNANRWQKCTSCIWISHMPHSLIMCVVHVAYEQCLLSAIFRPWTFNISYGKYSSWSYAFWKDCSYNRDILSPMHSHIELQYLFGMKKLVEHEYQLLYFSSIINSSLNYRDR